MNKFKKGDIVLVRRQYHKIIEISEVVGYQEKGYFAGYVTLKELGKKDIQIHYFSKEEFVILATPLNRALYL